MLKELASIHARSMKPLTKSSPYELPGLRRWYDIPFTVIESLTADRSFTLTVESAPGGQLPRIDTIEIYARSKEDFGWRAKAESMRELLQQNRAVPGGGAATGTQGPEVPGETSPGQVPVSPVEEGLCAGLEVLALFYSWATAGKVLSGLLAWKQLLETLVKFHTLGIAGTDSLAALRAFEIRKRL
jgi:E3 ubiquitin-protein ligase UBR4